ncbi:calcium/sodium antiporter [Candidatus Pacearchaeota archaeon]|nr:calcium/sodium antiporter [Candidatus Pacearchaeota archaeon]
MVITYLLFILGLVILIESANWIVDSSSSIAKRLGVSSLVIGLTIVSFGTTLPELVVNLFAAFSGNAEIAFGNVIGSYIANVLFVLGIVACFGNVRLKRETIWHEIPIALLAAFVLFILTGNLFGAKEFLTRDDAFILLGLLGVFLYYVFLMARRGNKDFNISAVVDKSNWLIGLKFLFGVIGIYFGGKWVVEGAVVIANQFEISSFLISATIIAVGTSLPELVVGIIAMIKKNPGLAVGNVIGANVLNVCWVLGVVPLISPLAIPAYIGVDIGVMFLAMLILFIFMATGEKHELRRKDGILMLLLYSLYIWYVIVRG